MSKRRRIIIGLAGGLFVIAAFWLLRRGNEPYYRGRPLSVWVASYYFKVEAGSEASKQDAFAISEMGATAVPFLLEWIRYDPSPGQRQWNRWIDAVKWYLHEKLYPSKDWFKYDDNESRSLMAPRAFMALQQYSHLAVPELTRILNDPKRHGKGNAAEALAYLGRPGVPPLMEGLNGTNAGLRFLVLRNIQWLGTNAVPAVPRLIQILGNDTERISWVAADALGNLQIEPDLVIPALVRALASTNSATRNASAQALGNFGPLAHAAIPSLTNLFSLPDQILRNTATNALHAIDPQTFTNTTTRGVE